MREAGAPESEIKITRKVYVLRRKLGDVIWLHLKDDVKNIRLKRSNPLTSKADQGAAYYEAKARLAKEGR